MYIFTSLLSQQDWEEAMTGMQGMGLGGGAGEAGGGAGGAGGGAGGAGGGAGGAGEEQVGLGGGLREGQ